MATKNLSKSKVLAGKQCPKRLWLQLNHPENAAVSARAQSSFSTGNQVGDMAIRLYSQNGQGHIINPHVEGWPQAQKRTLSLLKQKIPIFEATFMIDGALALADVMLPPSKNSKKGWQMIEVKSSTSVKDVYLDDVAFQYYVAKNAGIKLQSVRLACIDSGWIYPGDANYQGLLQETDLTEHAVANCKTVEGWLSKAHAVARKRKEPNIEMGQQCDKPYECEFKQYCSTQYVKAEFPIAWTPRPSKALKDYIEETGIVDMQDIPDDLLNEQQLLVKECTVDNEYYLDEQGAREELAQCRFPAYFLDFETINFAIPIWRGTRPYQQITFQYSVHKINRNAELSHTDFLDVSGNDPSLAFATKLIQDCGKRGSIFVYNQGFEKARIKELAQRFPALSADLLAINQRVIDLLPICRKYYYHPAQQGSWSIKKVLPNIAPELNYDDLEGVQHGGAAMDAFAEAIDPNTEKVRKAELEQQLLKYCELDTYAMVKIWEFFG